MNSDRVSRTPLPGAQGALFLLDGMPLDGESIQMRTARGFWNIVKGVRKTGDADNSMSSGAPEATIDRAGREEGLTQ